MIDYTDPAADLAGFRKVLGTFATGITVITTVSKEGERLGLTANSFTSVSLDPPLVLVCFKTDSNSLAALRESKVFAVNILSEDQRNLSKVFSSKEPDKFGGSEWITVKTGAPVSPGTVGWLDCTVHQTLAAGDHEIVIGRVQACGQGPARPLGYFRGCYTFVSLEQQASNVSGTALFGAIVEHERRVLLHRDAKGKWSFPEVAAGNSNQPLGGLGNKLEAIGAPVELNFLYSVAQLPDGRGTSIVYRGQLKGEPRLAHEDWRFAAEKEVPWADLSSYEAEMTLRRYFRERTEDSFGLFADLGSSGKLFGIGKSGRDYSPEDAERSLR